MFFSMNTAFCANESQQIRKVEQKRSVIRQKINSLLRLERKQTSIITKNQQKLEKNRQALKNSEKEFNEKQKNLQRLQNNLDSYLAQYNRRNSAMAERIRCIYKTKHAVIFDLFDPSPILVQIQLGREPFWPSRNMVSVS